MAALSFTFVQYLFTSVSSDLVLDVCSCLKYELIFHKIDLKETGNSFSSLFQF